MIIISIVTLIFNLVSIFKSAESVNSSESQPVFTVNDINSVKLDDEYSARCYGIYGCFPITYPWTSDKRAYGVFPFSPLVLDIKYPLFTHETRTNPTLLDINDLILKINANHPIYLIAHGFIEFGNAPWIIKLMNELLDHDNEASVVVVDWRGGSTPPYYQAVANIRVIGAMTAHLIFAMSLELELDNLDNFHLIGHSLGAHLCGYAGYFLRRDFDVTIGRITGLDPAKPYFEFTPEIVRLDRTDAKFVDIVHTDSSFFLRTGLGLKQPIGHVDFYPNNGEYQPACSNASNLYVTCHHVQSIELFTESINTNCPFTSISCDSYDNFKAGKCTNCSANGTSCLKFGFHSHESYKSIENSSISTFLLTSDSEPFCQVHNKVTIKLKHGSDRDTQIGSLEIIFNDSENFKLSDKIIFTPAESLSFLTHHRDTGDILSLQILFRSSVFFEIFKSKVNVDYVEIESIETGKVVKFCSYQNQDLINGKWGKFEQIYCSSIVPSEH